MTEPARRDRSELRYADDLAAGTTFDLGSYLVTPAEMLEFAEQWDPQGFHVDEHAGAESRFGRVIASGVYTLGVFQRLTVLDAYRHWAVIAGRRITGLEFLKPVVPGLELHGSLTILDNQPIDATRSVLTIDGSLAADGATLFTIRPEIYIERRRPTS